MYAEQKVAGPWCLVSNASPTEYYDISPCARKGIIQGLVPAIVVVISLMTLAYSFRKSFRSISLPTREGSVHHDTITEAEDNVISEVLKKAGLSWGGITLSKYTSSADARVSGNTPMLPSQRRKDITVFLLCILMCAQIIAKGYYVFQSTDSVYLRQGAAWSIVSFGVWTYYSILAFLRIKSSTRKSKSPNYQIIEKHLQFFSALYIVIEIIQFRASLIDYDQKILTQRVLYLDSSAMVFSLLFFLLEFGTKRASNWDDEYTNTVNSRESNNKNINIERKKSPELNSSILGSLFFTYHSKFVYKFLRNRPNFEDIAPLRPDDSAAAVLQRFRNDTKGMSASKYSITKKLAWHFRREIFMQFLLALPRPIAIIAPSIILKLLLDALADRLSESRESTSIHVIALLVFLIPIVQLLGAVTAGRSEVYATRLSYRADAILRGEIFSKALRRSDYHLHGDQNSKVKSTSGRILNLFVNDASTASSFFSSFADLISMPPVIVLSSVLLFHVLGWAAIFGMITMIAIFFFATACNKKVAELDGVYAAAHDERLNETSEVMASMKTIKFFAWGNHFIKKLQKSREKELRVLQRSYIFLLMQLVSLNSSSSIVAAISFMVLTLVLKRPLTASTAFTSMSLFASLRLPMDILGHKIAALVKSSISMQRIDEFLRESDTDKYDILSFNNSASSDLIGFRDSKFVWADWNKAIYGNANEASPDESDGSNNNNTPLQNFILDVGDLIFPQNKLSIVIGPVGSGKTSLLMALLGEMHCVDGHVYLPFKPMRMIGSDPNKIVNDTVAYCSQNPWLFSGPLRDNILFGSEFDPKRFDEVINACALDEDFRTMAHKDLTEIGQRGIVLSGGQKARVSFARALYSSAKTILLDDILSAVDAHTAEHLMTHGINGTLMKNRTCIMVTHNVSLCAPSASFVVLMDEGCVKKHGTPHHVGLEVAHFSKNKGPEKVGPKPLSVYTGKEYSQRKREHYGRAKKAVHGSETIQKGRISLNVYKFYFDSFGGWWAVTVLVLAFASSQAMDVSVNMWLREWARSYGTEDREDLAPGEYENTLFHVKIYCLLIASMMLLVGCRVSWYLHRGIIAGRKIYRILINRVMNYPMQFFEQIPEGNIVNRIARDVRDVDTLPDDILMFTTMVITKILGAIGAVTIITPNYLLIAAVSGSAFSYFGYLYARSSLELSRYVTATRSMFFQVLGESIAGVTVIRAYGDTGRYMKEILELIDNNSRPKFMLIMAKEWVSLRYYIVNSIMVFFTVSFIMINVTMDPATIGLVVTFILNLHELLPALAGKFSKMDIMFNPVERVKEYCENKEEKIDGDVPAAHWPSKNGDIVIKNLSVKYRDDLDCVLHDLSFTIKAKEKVAIVGRTGSGKSTLAISMFRFVEAAEGNITIDGLDISGVKLSELRSRLAIIPQDSTLFVGTIRYNLDPLGNHEDVEIWEVIQKVGVRVDSLDMQVEEAGKNFSAGEKQLLALARGLLRAKNASIIILDEPTSSLDHKADEAAQKAITRNDISDDDTTIVCIAHRISTIIGYDRVLVLGEGKILEYDEPATLLEQSNSAFRQLCLRTGDIDALEATAHKARQKRRHS